MNSRLLGLAAATLAVGVVSSCDDPTRPTTEASLSPNIALIQPDSATRASLILPLTGVRARTIGPTGRVLDLTLQGNTWRGTITGLAAGDYEVIIEGLASGQVQFYGRLASITLARGQRAQPAVPFAAAVPTVAPPALTNTTNFSQRAPMSRIAAATGYVVQVSQDLAFGSGVTEFTAPDTNPLVTVTQPGTWHLRTRAILPQIPATSVPWSDVRTWTVIQAAGGDAAGDAAPIVLVPEAPQTIAQRNLTPTKRNDWYDIDAEEGDSVFAETFAARLELASGLNTRLTLFEDDGTTQVAQNDDFNGSTDSRLVYVAAESKTYKLRVDGMASTSGHYELRTEIRRLPLAPESLVATIVSGTEVSLAWDDRSNNETSFRIERCEGVDCTTFTEIGNVAADVETFAATGLTQGNTYRFRVRARNNVGNSAFTNVVATALIGPAAPTNLVATTVSSTEIGLTWTDASNNEEDFQVERCTGADCTDFAVIQTLPAGTEAYADVSVVFNTAYSYRVRARNSVMASAYSDEAAANTIPPATPSALVATVTGPTSIGLVWEDNSDNELGFRIERCTGAACTNFAVVGNVGPNITAYADNAVANNEDYRYRVRAFNAVDGVDATNIANANTRPPAAPTGLTAETQGPTAIQLQWTDNATTETGYRIERCSSAPDCTDFALLTTIAADATGYTDNGVTVDNSYRYRVIAVGVAGNSAPTNVADANTLRPLAPTSLVATTISATVIRLTWQDNADNETGYVLRRCDTAGCSNFAIVATFDAPAVTYDDSTTEAGTSYVYQLRATNIAGQSDASNSAAANTLAPAAPTAFTATMINASRVDLEWVNNAPEATGTRVERCEGVGCSDFVEIAFVPEPASVYSDETVTQGSVWRYRIRAQNAADVSDYTAVASATTEVPAAVASLTYTILNGNQVQLDWDASAGPNLAQYAIYRCTGVGCTVTDLLNLVNSDQITYTDGSVTPGNTYRYVVSAVGAAGESPPSDVATVEIAVPAVPSGFSATVRRGDIQLAWTSPPGAATVEIERCEGDPCGAFALISTLSASNGTLTDATVVADQAYGYRIRAENAIGHGAYSSVATAFTTLSPAPSGLTADVISGTQVDLLWTDNALTETGFSIERCLGDACSDYAVIDTVAPNTLSFSDLTVEIGNAYGYRVRSLAPFGASAPSNAVEITTRIPEAPTDLVAQTLSNTSIRLTWTDNSDNEQDFAIQRCAGVDCTVPAGSFATVAAGQTEFVDTGLDANETYTYHVFAANAVGNSAPTNTATATTNLPAIPASIEAFVTAGDIIRLVWQDASADEDGFRVERCVGAGCTDFAEIAETLADVAEYFDNPVIDGTVYRYRVRAFNAAGNSDYSPVRSITAGLPVLPGEVTVTTLSGTSIRITWADLSDNESGFQVARCTGDGCTGFTALSGVARNTQEFIDSTVVPGEIYRFRVAASNGAGSSGFTDYVDGNTMTPDAPSDLAATTFSASQINLTWTDNGPYETGFQVERCVGAGCSSFTLLTTVPADATEYADTGLAQNESYSYRVRAVNAVANSAYTDVATATTDLPAAPTDLAALPLSATEVELSWTDNANNEENYLVERCEGTDCSDFAFLALLGVDVETYNDATVLADLTYRYRVRAIGSAGPSPNSNVAEAITSVPGDPSDLTATTLAFNRIDLAWTDNGVNELNYRIERCVGPACSDFTELTVLPAGTTEYSDETVDVDLSYQYRVRASNNVGVSGYSNEAAANTLRPASPSGLGAQAVSATQVDLTWTDNADNELGFIIERCAGVSCTDFAAIDTVGANAAAFADQTVDAEQDYRYRVFGYNVSGLSDAIAAVDANTRVPAVPSDFTVEVLSANAMQLSWTDEADNEVGYRIERCSGAGCTSWLEIGTTGPDATGFTSTGLVINTFYRHRVRAYNASGSSAYTPIVQVGTFPPTAPNTLVATTQTATQVNLQWNDASTNEDGFQLQRCTGADCSSWAVIDTLLPSSPSSATGTLNAADMSVVAGEFYRYRLRSFNGVGLSATFSNIAEASTTVPAAPSALVANPAGQTTMNLQWSDNSADETGFVIERCLGNACTDFAVVDSVPANASDYADTGVTGDNIYRYRVLAYGNGNSEYSNIALGSTIIPAAPASLVAVAPSDDRVELTWTDAADNEDFYRISRCTGADCTNFVQIGLLPPNSSAFDDETVAVNTLYRYIVTAVNGAGESDASNIAEAETDVPGQPTDLVATIEPGPQVRLDWTDNATTETGFEIERCAGVSCTDFTLLATVGEDVTTYTESVGVSEAYRYRVRAVTATRASGYTGIVLASTNPPAAPTDFASNITTDKVDLVWTDNADNELGYEVERCDGTDCETFALLETLAAGSTTYRDLSAVIDTIYRYRIRAVNASGESDYSGTVTVSTYRPPVPTDFTATPQSATSVQLAWTDNSVIETGFEIDRCLGAACTEFVTVATLSENTTEFLDITLTPDQTYTYRMRALNVWGASDYTAVAEASTDIPLPPSDLIATLVSENRVDLQWTDNSGVETGFTIERCADIPSVECSDFTELTTLGANVTSFSDESVVLGQRYRYRVLAFSAAGASDFSAVAEATVEVPADVTLDAAAVVSPTGVDLQWTPVPNADDYVVVRTNINTAEVDTVATLPHPTAQYLDVATTGETYEYRVVGVNVIGAGGGTVLTASLNPPPAPTDVAAVALSPTQVQVTWTDNGIDEIRFWVQRCDGSDCEDFANIVTLGGNVTEYLDEDVVPGGKYRYRVTTANEVGLSVPSAAVFVNLSAPDAPSGLSATVTGATQITVQWTVNSDNETGLSLERCSGTTCTDFLQIASLSAGVNTYLDNGVAIGPTYRYRVRAFNGVGQSDYSNIGQATIELPSGIGALTATPVNGERIDLAWGAAAVVAGYRVERCTGPACESFAPIANVSAATLGYVDDNGPSYGGTFRYRVVPFNIAGDGTPSTPAQVALVLAAPVLTQPIVQSLTDVQLDFSYASTWESGIEIFRCEGVGCTPALYTTLPKGSTTFSEGVAPASDYAYAVRQATVGGASGFSVLRRARTPITLSNAVAVTGLEDSQGGAERHFVFNVPADALGVRFQMGGAGATGDPDLYVKFAQPPLATEVLNDATNCVPYIGGTSETCTFNTPVAGNWFAMTRAFSPYGGTELKASLAQRFGWPGAQVNTACCLQDLIIGQKVELTEPVSVTHFGATLASSVGGLLRLGIYSNRVAGEDQPDLLVTQLELAAPATGLVEAPVSEVILQPGKYWIAAVTNFNSVFASEGVSQRIWYYFRAYGSGFEATWPSTDIFVTNYQAFNIWFRGYR
ncbi:MAG: hypothetical protein KF689_01280 [Gemmatimonadaceae bacterium]|nr:hypothetical protein [Gemmatimonadaceae bacterium]MCW5826563.1 hypothetical protein [Gemmatimonadaceae bacterium]